MPTYKSSPFVGQLQSYLFTSTALDATGVIDAIGTKGTLYAVHAYNKDGAARYVSFWDATETSGLGAEMVIRLDVSSNATIYIDTGLRFDTAVTFNGSTNAWGSGDPTELDVNLCIS
tara:strand:- start:1516 stop:1866 length:351 start_codon:yes stop_codon:yes gene_type:complete